MKPPSLLSVIKVARVTLHRFFALSSGSWRLESDKFVFCNFSFSWLVLFLSLVSFLFSCNFLSLFFSFFYVLFLSPLTVLVLFLSIVIICLVFVSTLLLYIFVLYNFYHLDFVYCIVLYCLFLSFFSFCDSSLSYCLMWHLIFILLRLLFHQYEICF